MMEFIDYKMMLLFYLYVKVLKKMFYSIKYLVVCELVHNFALAFRKENPKPLRKG